MPKTAKKNRKHTSRKKGFLESLFNSTNVKLFTILIIAAAIPLTIIGLSQVQNLRDEAASTPKAGKDCTQQAGSAIIATPLSPEFGQTISFKKAIGSFSQQDFTTGVVFGNGIDSNKCSFTNGEIQNCPTKKGKTETLKIGTETKRGTVHTITQGGNAICDYYVLLKETKPAPTKGPPKGSPQHTPTPGNIKPTNPPNGNASVNMNAADCNASNNPRLTANWNLTGGVDGKCSVILSVGSEQWTVDTKCSKKTGFVIDTLPNSRTPLKPDTQYSLKVDNGSGQAKATATITSTTHSCKGSNPSGGNGSPSGFGAPETADAKCQGEQDSPQIVVSWALVEGAKSYTVKLSTSQGGNAVKQKDASGNSVTFDEIQKDQRYWYTVTAVDTNGKKSSPTSNTRNIKCTNADLQPVGVISAVAQTFQDMLDALTNN